MTQTMSAYSSATRALTQEYKSMMEDPVEGFRVKLMTDDLFNWEVAIFGPPDTPYQGGYFKAHMKFPKDYPYAPPSLRFLSKVWHPNVYENGDLCISILHPPVADPQSGEDPSERWNPTQNVRTILLSVISLLNEPNTSSPANVDASVMYRRWKESNGADKEYENIIRHQVNATKSDADRDNVVVPLTQEEWCMRGKHNPLSGPFDGSSSGGGGAGSAHSTFFLDHVDIYTDDGYDEDDDDDEPITTEEEEEDTPTEPEIGAGAIDETDDVTSSTTTTTSGSGATTGSSSSSSSHNNPRRRRPIILAPPQVMTNINPSATIPAPPHSSASSHYI